MKHTLILVVTLFLCACGRNNDVATRMSFDEVGLGITKEELISKMGHPLSKEIVGPNQEELRYLEMVKINNLVIEEREYTFLVENGKVADKHIKNITPRPRILPRNAYDLQTSQNETSAH